MEQFIQQHPSVIKAILTTFIFQGTYLAMGVYMFLVYVQAKKKDYLLYSIYLLLFAAYFFVRVDQVFETNLIISDQDTSFYFTIPLLFLITGVYIDFINTFATIQNYSRQFSREVSLFSKIMYSMTALTVGYLLITQDVDTVRKYVGPVFALVHIYALYSVIRAFIVIKSTLRYYVLASNLFLISLTAIGLNVSAGVKFHEGIYANTFYGYYPVNISQLGVFLEMLCFALGLGYKFNQIELEKDKIQKLDTLKTQLYTNISHEIRTPLTLISGPVNNQLNKPNIRPEDRRELLLVKTNADRLLQLVNQMLDLSVIDSGGRYLKVSRENMAVILKQLIECFQYQANIRNIHIRTNISGLDDVWFDRDVIEKIIANLLSNATKYAVDNSTIVFDARQVGGHAELSVSNITHQAKANDLNQLFKRFYQENMATAGAGVGLALVKELVELTKGKINVHKQEDQRICFSVIIPIERATFEPDKCIYADEPEVPETFDDLSDTTEPRTTILVVEDDHDIREFTASIFRQDYRVLMAVDGQEGLERAVKALPDVVITDIMMPGMNGMELCQSLKTNVMTSHIPVLMLTARAGEAYELEGYKMGADTYLTKPYHTNILKLKIRNLIADRNRFRRQYSQSFSIDPTLAVTPIEENFLTGLKRVCETHITNSELTAERLADYMNMSRSQLHRKLHAVFGISATAFIRSQRIKLACELFVIGNITVSEAAYRVGFGTVSYFNKCFKEQMSCTPQEYVRQKCR